MPQITFIYGYVELRETMKAEGNKLYLGGYAIKYDLHGNEVSRTEPTCHVVITANGEGGNYITGRPHYPLDAQGTPSQSAYQGNVEPSIDPASRSFSGGGRHT